MEGCQSGRAHWWSPIAAQKLPMGRQPTTSTPASLGTTSLEQLTGSTLAPVLELQGSVDSTLSLELIVGLCPWTLLEQPISSTVRLTWVIPHLLCPPTHPTTWDRWDIMSSSIHELHCLESSGVDLHSTVNLVELWHWIWPCKTGRRGFRVRAIEAPCTVWIGQRQNLVFGVHEVPVQTRSCIYYSSNWETKDPNHINPKTLNQGNL